MVITISCPSCSDTFPVDPAKIPEAGVNVRCSSCSHVFRVERPAEPEAEAEPQVAEPEPEPDFSAEFDEPAVEEPETPVAEDDWVVETDEDTGGSKVPDSPVMDEPAPQADATSSFFGGGAETEEPVVDEPAPSFDAEDAVEEEPTIGEPVAEEVAIDEAPSEDKPSVQAFSFGARDPLQKAKRLARVLVSDMIMYNPERHERALANNTLKEDFEEEVEKSWKEYIEQVGDEIAEGSDFWKEALNDVLAKGESIF